MTTHEDRPTNAYFDSLRGWLRDLGQSKVNPLPLLERTWIVNPPIADLELEPRALERLGWACYIRQFAPDNCVHMAAPSIIQAIEARLRRDLRYLDAALYAMTGSLCMEFCALWRNHPPYEGTTPEDLAPMTQRVTRLCSAAHDLMHYIAATYGVSDNPTTAAEQAMDRADGKDSEGGKP